MALDIDGKVTSLMGTTLRWSDRGQLVEAQPPVPAPVETYGHDGYLRRISRTAGSVEEFYLYEGPNRVGVIHEGAAGAVVVDETALFAGVDDALRMKRGATTVYFETDLAGNVRRLRSPGGGDLGGYRYSAFGRTLEDSTTVVQWLRFKGRWASDVAGGIYDVRARQWSPNLGAFLTIDEFAFYNPRTTLWGWPSQNPLTYRDPSGHQPDGPPLPWSDSNFRLGAELGAALGALLDLGGIGAIEAASVATSAETSYTIASLLSRSALGRALLAAAGVERIGA